MGAVYNKCMEALPPDLAGRIDFSRNHLREGWGGPFNGQRHRQDIVRGLYRAIDFATTVETGSFRGESTEFMAALSGRPVLSVESSPRFLAFAQRRCAPYPNAEFFLSDSRSFLAARLPQLSGPTFFYLDAHWYADLPLADEVTAIAASGIPAVIMIDDFEVPGDSGYSFDDYGPGARLTRELLDGCGVDDWSWFYPQATSAEESGLRRGSVVLASPALADEVASVAGLRREVGAAS